MPTLYNYPSDQIRYDEPNLTRWRHRLRGPRESLKFNSETRAIDLDFDALYDGVSDQSILLAEDNEIVEEGGEVNGVYEQWDDATPTEEPLVLDGIDNLTAQITALRDRVQRLERNG